MGFEKVQVASVQMSALRPIGACPADHDVARGLIRKSNFDGDRVRAG